MAEPFGDHPPIEPSPPPSSSVSGEIKARATLGQRYKVPLSELVSKIVASDSTEYERLQEAIKPDFAVQPELIGVLRKEDWEKALNDEANFQFSSRHRPLVETVLNSIDTQLRKEVHTDIPIPHKTVAVRVTDNGFTVQDQGEGMDLDTVLVKLLVPKLTGNTMEKSDVIGRFGVGFYSLLSYLRDPHDNVIIRTTDGNEGWRISIGKYFSEDQITSDNLSVVISPLNDIDRQRIGQGTEVAVHARSFDKVGAERYLSDTLQYKPDAAIVLNDRVVNDVQNFETLEADLPERRDEKQRKIRILESQEEGEGARVVIAVGGVKIEEFSAKGSELPQTVVLDFPPGTALPKSRDKLEVNEQTIEAVDKVIDTVLNQASGVEQTARLVTAIAPVVSELQSRNPLAYRSSNVHIKLREGVETWGRHLPEGRYLVPDVKAMEKLNLSGAIRIAPDYLPTNLTIPGLEQDFFFASAKARLFWAPFKNPQDVFAIANGTVFLNEGLKTTDPRRLAAFNALLQTSDQSVREEDMKAGGQFRVLVSQEEVRSSPPQQEPPPQRPRSETAKKEELPKETQAFLESIKPYLPPTPIFEDLLVIDNNLAEPSEFPRSMVERLFRRRMSDASFTRKEVGYSYVPQSVEQLKDLWLRYHVTGATKLLMEDGSYAEYGLPKNPAFWEGVLTDEFYQTLPVFVNIADAKTAMETIIAFLPESIKGHVRERVAVFEKESFPLAGYDAWGTVLSELMGEVSRSNPVGEADQKAVAQAGLRTLVANQLRDNIAVFNDDSFLAMLTTGGEFASFADRLFQGKEFERRHNVESDAQSGSMDNFVNANSYTHTGYTEGILDHEWEPLNSIRTTEGKADYVRWYLRNQDQLLRFQNQRNYETINDVSYSVRPSEPNAVLYLSGIDSENAWENATHNFQLLREFTHDTTLEPILFKSTTLNNEFKHPRVPLQFLTAGRIERANIAVLKSRLDSESFPKEENKIDYAIKALAYSHLPPDVFSQWNDLLVRMATEPSDVSSFYRSTPIGDGWRMDSIPAAYRLTLDTPSVIQSRLALLENLPTDYARVYLKLQTMLVDPRDGIPFTNNQEAHANAERKIADMLQKLAEMPQAEAKRILSALSSESDYGKAHLKESLGRYERLDRIARPWLLYLANEGSALPQRHQEAFMGEETSQIALTGSDLVGQYFTSESLANVATIGELQTLAFRDRDRSRAKEVGQRRIEHAVNYQSTQGYVWLRELVQNAYNATRAHGGERTVHIENYLEGPDFVISVTDPVGMPLQRVVNSLLVPQKSEWEGQGTLGYFGHGFFTTFKEADEVRIKTSQGNGQTMYAVITPQRDRKSGKVLDLNITIGSKAEQYQGTSVYWVKKTDFQDFEASRARAELATYAGLMPENELAIMWNGEQINRNPVQIAQVPSPFGDVKLYAVAGENTLTQHGLYIKDLDSQYTSAIPQALRDILLKQGVSLDLPGGLQLIDSRADIARKEEIVPLLSPIISEAAIRGAVQMFVSGQVRFDSLPYDFFTQAEQYAAAVDEQVRTDAQTLAQDQTIANWDNYFQSDEKVLQLIMSIPVLDLDEKKVSVYEAIRLAKEDPSVIEKLPEGLQKIFTHETEVMRESISEDETRFSEEGYTIANDFRTEALPPEFDTYEAWQEMYRQLLAPSIQRTGMDIQTTLYSKPDGSIAHYKPGTQEIGWNLLHMGEHVGTLRKILRGESVSGSETMGLYQFMIYTGSHEYQHRLEGTEESLTHNAAFFDGQKRIIEDIIRAVDPQGMEQTLRSSFTGGFQPPAQFSKVAGPTASQ